jgi:hypothetical protein
MRKQQNIVTSAQTWSCLFQGMELKSNDEPFSVSSLPVKQEDSWDWHGNVWVCWRERNIYMFGITSSLMKQWTFERERLHFSNCHKQVCLRGGLWPCMLTQRHTVSFEKITVSVILTLMGFGERLSSNQYFPFLSQKSTGRGCVGISWWVRCYF